MSERADQLVLDYLSRVADAAHGRLRPDQRIELLRQLRARIDTAREQAGASGPVQVQQVLAAFGDPVALVEREQRGPDRADGDPTRRTSADSTAASAAAPPPTGYRRTRRPASRRRINVMDRARSHRLESVAIVLVGFGTLALPLLWIPGAALGLASRLWAPLDKTIGIAAPLLLTGLFVFVRGAAHTTSPLSVHAYTQAAQTAGPLVFRLGALFGAGFLAWRLVSLDRDRRGRE